MALKHDSNRQMELTSNVLASNKVWLGWRGAIIAAGLGHSPHT